LLVDPDIVRGLCSGLCRKSGAGNHSSRLNNRQSNMVQTGMPIELLEIGYNISR
jgi:hypothetical protein